LSITKKETYTISQDHQSTWIQDLGAGSESCLFDQRCVDSNDLGGEIIECPDVGIANAAVHLGESSELFLGLMSSAWRTAVAEIAYQGDLTLLLRSELLSCILRE
jgi:hypothetical protein